MAEQQLSPGAQAALDAGMEYSGPAFEPLVRRMVAAAIRALADQVVPEQGCPIYGLTQRENEQQQVRSQLLAIADELEETLQ